MPESVLQPAPVRTKRRGCRPRKSRSAVAMTGTRWVWQRRASRLAGLSFSPMKKSREPGPASRPLRSLGEAELAARWKAALAEGDGVLGAHCIHEQWMRGGYPANIEAALDSLWARAAKTIP